MDDAVWVPTVFTKSRQRLIAHDAVVELFNQIVVQADGYAEREAAKAMINDARQTHEQETSLTLVADKGYDAQEFIEALQQMNVLPHVAQNTSGRKSAVPDAVAASEGYAISQQTRKRIEQGFGWAKTVGHIRQVLVRWLQKVDQMLVLTMTAYNLTRLRMLGRVRPQGKNERKRRGKARSKPRFKPSK